MGNRSKTALTCMWLTGLIFLAALATPWYWIKVYDGTEHEVTNCFIDGTCRNGDFVYKNNADAQPIYDWTLVSMIIALCFFLVFMHLLFVVVNPVRYPEYDTGKIGWMVLFGLLSVLATITATILFSVGLDSRGYYEEFWGEDHTHDQVKRKFGGNAGWFLTMFGCITLVCAIIAGATVRKKHYKHKYSVLEKHGPHQRTIYQSTTTSVNHPVSH